MAGAALAALPVLANAQTAEPIDLLPPQSAPVIEVDTAAQPASSAQAAELQEEFDAAITRQIDPKVQPWSGDHAEKLADFIQAVGAEGLNPADYRLGALRSAIAAGSGIALDEAASQSFAWLVEDIRDGRTPMDARKQWFVFDPDADRYPTGRLLTEALASGDIAGTLAQIVPEHPDYALLREELARAEAGSKRHKLIRANMERWRWLPRDLGNQYLMTNVPEFQLRLTVNDQIISTYRTIVGKPGRTATPQMAEMVEGVIFNPTWTVPQSIVKGEGLGARVLSNPAWARNKGYKATRGANGWVSVVQQPGPTNSLGLMKLDMPNKHAIFLHDTPSRGLFDRDQRALSHGCIRTERASELAITMAILGAGLTGDEGVAHLTSRKYTKVGFTKKMPVYITYFTMAQDIEGELSTFADIYGRDAPVLASLDAPRKANRSRVTGEQIIPIEDDMRIALN
ncbi:MAG: L,D-transpeptidase family protein [Alteripontixanthobacter sp.]